MITDFNGKNILVAGFGKSGRAMAEELLKKGASVTVQDSREEKDHDPAVLAEFREAGAAFLLGEEPADPAAFDLYCLSPGVSPELGYIEAAKEAGVEVIGELELAYRMCRGTFVAITGTNGKTTTTTLTGEIFKASGRKTHVVGNIGTPVTKVAPYTDEDDWLVTEASSFQLEMTDAFRPMVSAILNLTPDHLNRHHTMEAYGRAKAKVFANQGASEVLVVNKDDPLCYALADGCRAKVVPFTLKEEPAEGAYLDGTKLMLKTEETGKALICDRSELRIIGDHNVQNVLAAALVAYYSGIGLDTIRDAVKAFPGVEHRIEFVRTLDGVDYYNDSKGTNTDAAETAIKAIGKNIILIAGGDAKKQDFDDFAKCLEGKVKKILFLGRDAYMIMESCDKAGFKDYEKCKDLKACVEKAHEIAEEGDTVLLSPACASWDMYKNYEIRGNEFKELVRDL